MSSMVRVQYRNVASHVLNKIIEAYLNDILIARDIYVTGLARSSTRLSPSPVYNLINNILSCINMDNVIQTFVVLLWKLTYKRPLRKLWKRSSSVVFLTPNVCIKSSPFTTLAEAHAMMFVKKHTNVPVPKIYMAFERKGRVYIVMERIQATMLRSGWASRPAASQQKILQNLKAMIEEMRSIPPPKGTGVANVDGGPIYDERLPKTSLWGPFSSIDEFHCQLRNGIMMKHVPSEDSLHSELRSLIQFHSRVSSAPVFTHSDLSSLNILCRDDEVVGIVDWETAGWMPDYWEYVSAWHVNPHNEFWPKEVEKFIAPCPEALEMETIRRKHFGVF